MADPFVHRLRVRYSECDQQGWVFNGHYLTWADEASNHWWAAQGLQWDTVAARVDPVVKASTLDWTSSARWGDTVTVEGRGVGVIGHHFRQFIASKIGLVF